MNVAYWTVYVANDWQIHEYERIRRKLQGTRGGAG